MAESFRPSAVQYPLARRGREERLLLVVLLREERLFLRQMGLEERCCRLMALARAV